MMAFDPLTILTLTIAIAAAAALYLMLEWQSVREPSLLYWSAGFATITLGSTLATLRGSGHLLVGIWLANGLLVVAHALFLLGVIRFTRRRLSRFWGLMAAPWVLLLLFDPHLSSRLFLTTNSLLVAVLSIRASILLHPRTGHAGAGTAQLHYVLLGHGIFYLSKAAQALIPGTLIDLTDYRGLIVQISLVEGVMAILLIALSMTGVVRYRREREIEQLAERDPLTALANRRALERCAPGLLSDVTESRPGALLLIDVDNFKLVNDLHGHGAGDRLLVMLSDLIREVLPDRALAARLGGDEFILLLEDTGQQHVERLGEVLRERFHAQSTRAFETPAPVTLSIGAMLFGYPPDRLETLVSHVDRILYEAKRGGRNRLNLSVQALADHAGRAELKPGHSMVE